MSRVLAENLRQQLQRQFPQAHQVRLSASTLANEARPFDPAIFPLGRISEVIPAGHGSGLALMFAALLGESGETSQLPELALVDATDCFDPSSYSAAACSRLLWVRCASAFDMIRAADLLVHDGNMPLAMLDATGLSAAERSSIPSSAWWRLAQRVEANGIKLVVVSPCAWIPGVRARFALTAELTLADFDEPRTALLARLQVHGERFRNAK